MEKVLERRNMQAALRRVKRNRGSPGVDGMTVEELLPYLWEHWEQIKSSLLDGTYRPSPVKRQEIPKSGGGVRELGIPTVLDRLIQQALLQVLQPIIDPTFSEHSYGFRPRRSAHGALRAAQRYVQEGRRIVVDVDLERFFDRVNHDVLMGKLAKRIGDKRVLGLIRAYLRSGVMVHGVRVERWEGTPQGGPLSPLLANVLLDEVDKELEKRGRAFVRYAGDGPRFSGVCPLGVLRERGASGGVQESPRQDEASSAADHESSGRSEPAPGRRGAAKLPDGLAELLRPGPDPQGLHRSRPVDSTTPAGAPTQAVEGRQHGLPRAAGPRSLGPRGRGGRCPEPPLVVERLPPDPHHPSQLPLRRAGLAPAREVTSTLRTAVVRTRMPGGVGGDPAGQFPAGPYPDRVAPGATRGARSAPSMWRSSSGLSSAGRHAARSAASIWSSSRRRHPTREPRVHRRTVRGWRCGHSAAAPEGGASEVRNPLGFPPGVDEFAPAPRAREETAHGCLCSSPRRTVGGIGSGGRNPVGLPPGSDEAVPAPQARAE